MRNMSNQEAMLLLHVMEPGGNDNALSDPAGAHVPNNVQPNRKEA